MSHTLYVVDAFTDRPFAGNPAAVCVTDSPRDPEWMQQVAQELNLSETAFLYPLESGGWHLRWFTPGAEVALCGHATLASAFTLWQTGALSLDAEARFHTLSGWLSCKNLSPTPLPGSRSSLGKGLIHPLPPPFPAKYERPHPEGTREGWGGEVTCGYSARTFCRETVRSVPPIG